MLLCADCFYQRTWIKYKVIQIEPKVDFKKRTGKSPDFAKVFMLTFTQEPSEPRIG